MSKKNIALIALSVLVLISVIYIVNDIREEKKQEVDTAIYNKGAQDAVIGIMNVVGQCQQLPVNYQNQTVNLVLLECIQLAQQQEVNQNEEREMRTSPPE